MPRFLASPPREQTVVHLNVEDAWLSGPAPWEEGRNRVRLYRRLLAREAAGGLEEPGRQRNPRGTDSRRCRRRPRPRPRALAGSPARQRPHLRPRPLHRLAPPTASDPAPGRALPRPGPARSATQRSCGGARAHPNPPPSGSGDARSALPPRRPCPSPSGDSICSRAVRRCAGSGERCTLREGRRPRGQAAARSPAGCGGDTRAPVATEGPGLPPREQRRPALELALRRDALACTASL